MNDLTKLSAQLQDNEIEVLKSLQRSKTGQLESMDGMSQIEFLRAGMWLENKKLVEKEKKTIRVVALDKSGKKYAKELLPELRLLPLLKKKSMILEKAERHFSKDEIRFAIGYLKQKGYVTLVNGLISITSTGRKVHSSLEQDLLKNLAKQEELAVSGLEPEQRHALANLRRRKQIIKEIDRNTIILALTPTGKRLKLPKGKSVGVLSKDVLGDWKKVRFRRYDVSAGVPAIFPGKKQAYRAFLDDVKQEMLAMGFKEEESAPMVEAAFFNNDALFMPQDHPARGVHDIYFVQGKANLSKYKNAVRAVKQAHETGGQTGSRGWGGTFSVEETRKLLLRSHDTALSPRTMLSPDFKVPGKYFTISRCYRPDQVDWKHLTEFNQMGGFVVGQDLTFRQLLGLLAEFCKRVTGAKEIKFTPAYFPFTEPSVECHIKIGGEWIEAAGAGVFRPEFTETLGIKEPVLAWGFGIERLFMVRDGIRDIRQLFSSDLKWLREAKV